MQGFLRQQKGWLCLLLNKKDRGEDDQVADL